MKPTPFLAGVAVAEQRPVDQHIGVFDLAPHAYQPEAQRTGSTVSQDGSGKTRGKGKTRQAQQVSARRTTGGSTQGVRVGNW